MGQMTRHRALRRAQARDRVLARAKTTVPREIRARGLILEKNESYKVAIARISAFGILSLFAHIVIVGGFSRLDDGNSTTDRKSRKPEPEKVTMRVISSLKGPETPPAAPPTQPVVEAEKPTRKPLPEQRNPRITANRQLKKINRKPAAEADPIDPIEASSAQPRRRVVGLSFASTVSGGKGPQFAIGNTRMGATASRAAEPSEVERLARTGDSTGSPVPGPNRVTTRIPNNGDSFVKPKRLSRTPVAYPSSLKARRIEGDVMLLIDIASTGQVGKVMVLRSSGYQELDDAARKAAIKERFAPAKRNGNPVDYTLKYTYRFRIKDA